MGITIPSLHVLARNAARWLWGLTHPPPRQLRRVCTVCPQRRTHGGAGAAPSARNAEHTEGRGLRATRTCGLRPLSRSLATPRPRPLRGRAR